MKIKQKKLFSFFLIFLMVFFSCNKNSEEINNQDYALIDISAETDWNYLMVSNDDQSYFFIGETNSGGYKMFFRPNPGFQGYPIYFNDKGLPEMAIIDNYIFLFDNFTENKLDIAIIDEDGNINIHRGIKSEYNLTELINSKASILNWKLLSMSASVAVCGIGFITTPAGIGIPLVVLGCGATALMLGAELLPDDYEILGLSGNAIGAFATTLGCIQSSGVTCLLGGISEAATIIDAYSTMSNENSNTIAEAQLSLSNYPVVAGNYAITGRTYGINDNWSVAVENELGTNFRPLDWTELEDYHDKGGDLLVLFDELDLEEYHSSAFVLRNGMQLYSTYRGYYASRHEHNKPSNYLAHDNIDNYLISLGSWDSHRKILAIRK
jgi:hypothetical protein